MSGTAQPNIETCCSREAACTNTQDTSGQDACTKCSGSGDPEADPTSLFASSERLESPDKRRIRSTAREEATKGAISTATTTLTSAEPQSQVTSSANWGQAWDIALSVFIAADFKS
jgi:hypothetical protein